MTLTRKPSLDKSSMFAHILTFRIISDLLGSQTLEDHRPLVKTYRLSIQRYRGSDLHSPGRRNTRNHSDMFITLVVCPGPAGSAYGPHSAGSGLLSKKAHKIIGFVCFNKKHNYIDSS